MLYGHVEITGKNRKKMYLDLFIMFLEYTDVDSSYTKLRIKHNSLLFTWHFGVLLFKLLSLKPSLLSATLWEQIIFGNLCTTFRKQSVETFSE